MKTDEFSNTGLIKKSNAKKIHKSQTNKLNTKKGLFKFALGTAIVITTFSGFSALRKNKTTTYRDPIAIEQVDTSHIGHADGKYTVNHSNLEIVDGMTLNDNIWLLDLSDNLLTNIDNIQNTENIKYLFISNNSIDHLDLSKFPNLYGITISGNYELYTQEILDYCIEHDITIDINQKEIDNVNTLREYLEGMQLDGLSDLEKERTIYKFVMDHLEYDMKAYKTNDTEKAIEYNKHALEHAIDGKGVCANYAAMFDAMCDISGIDAYTITGTMTGGAHAWNLIEIDGQYMLCDATNSDSNLGNLAHFLNEVTGINLDMFFNETNSIVYRTLYSETDNYLKKIDNARTQMAYSSKPIRRDESIISLMGKKIYENTGLEESVNSLKEYVSSISLDRLTSEQVQQVYKYVLLAAGAGSVILISANQAKKIVKSAKKNNKEQTELPINDKKESIQVSNISKTPTMTEKPTYVNKAQVNSEIMTQNKQKNVQNISKQDTISPTQDDPSDEFTKAVAYKYDNDRLYNHGYIEKQLSDYLNYYLSTMNLTREQRAYRTLVTEKVFDGTEIPGSLFKLKQDALDAQIRQEMQISLALEKMKIQSGNKTNSSEIQSNELPKIANTPNAFKAAVANKYNADLQYNHGYMTKSLKDYEEHYASTEGLTNMQRAYRTLIFEGKLTGHEDLNNLSQYQQDMIAAQIRLEYEISQALATMQFDKAKKTYEANVSTQRKEIVRDKISNNKTVQM